MAPTLPRSICKCTGHCAETAAENPPRPAAKFGGGFHIFPSFMESPVSPTPPSSGSASAAGEDATHGIARPVLYGIFFLSGLSALIYQLVWQRSLLTLFGSNVESVAIVVSAFMIGLGLGSLFGGWLSEKPGLRLLLTFSAVEAVIGLYGLFSLGLFKAAGSLTNGSLWQTGLLSFGLLLLPTLFMGSTLPLLVTHHVRHLAEVGRSVSWLYFVNTLGAAAGCLAAACFTLPKLGMHGSVKFAASLNALAALLMFLNSWRERRV